MADFKAWSHGVRKASANLSYFRRTVAVGNNNAARHLFFDADLCVTVAGSMIIIDIRPF